MRPWGLRTAVATGSAIMTLLLPTLVSAQPAALNQASADADLIILVPNLQRLSSDVAELRQTLNLPLPELDDSLAAFKQSTGMIAGVEDGGSLLIVIADLAQAIEANDKPEAIMLVPVSDYDAFVQNFGGEAGDVSAVTMPGGAPGFVKKLGDYAVMGETREGVAAYEPGNAAAAIRDKVGNLGQRYLNSADALLYVDMEAMAPTLLPALRESMDGMAEMLEAMGQMDRASRTMFDMYGAAAETFVKDTNGVVVALDISASGVGLTYAAAYKPGSTLAQVFRGGQSASARLTTLPSKPFIYAAAFNARAIDFARLSRGMAAIFDQPENPLRELSEKWLPLMEKLEGGATAFYAPEMGMMGNFLNTATVVEAADGQSYVQEIKNYIEVMNGMQLPMGPMDPEGGEADPAQVVSYSTSYTPNVLQLEGQSIDQFNVQTIFPPEMLQQMGPAGGFANMLGSYSGYVTARDNHVIMTTVLDPQLVTNTLQQLEKRGGIGAAGVIPQFRDEALPPDPIIESYVGIDGIAITVNTVMQMFGGPQMAIPQDLPPLASGLSIRDNSLAFRTYMPTETLKYIVETAMSMQQQFGGMGGPGIGPMPGGPPPF